MQFPWSRASENFPEIPCRRLFPNLDFGRVERRRKIAPNNMPRHSLGPKPKYVSSYRKCRLATKLARKLQVVTTCVPVIDGTTEPRKYRGALGQEENSSGGKQS